MPLHWRHVVVGKTTLNHSLSYNAGGGASGRGGGRLSGGGGERGVCVGAG